MRGRSANYVLFVSLVSCFLQALAQAHTQADVPWPSPSSPELANLLKRLKLTTPSDSRAAVPTEPVQAVLRERNRFGMPDPATKRANPIDQYSDLLCGMQDIVLPSSTREVAAAVRYYFGLVPPYQDEAQDAVKIRVASRIRGIPMANLYREVTGMGERPGFSCPKGTRTAVIATQDLNQVLHRDGRHVTVQAGITMTELIDWANANELTLPLGTVPSYLDLTIGGLVATGGHAQGPKGASNVADMVTDITFVDGTGEIHTVDRYCLEGRGLSGGLGMLGIITEVTLKLQPGLCKTKLWGVGPLPDTNMEQQLADMIRRYDGRLYVSWRPDLGLVKYRVWEEVPKSTASDPPETRLTPTRAGAVRPETDAFLIQQAGALAAITVGDPSLCPLLGAALTDLKLVSIGNTAATIEPRDNATALVNNMQGSDCNRPANPTTGAPAAGSCFFDPRVAQVVNAVGLPSFTIEEAEFAVPFKDLASVLADIRAMKGLGGPCWSPSFIQIRPGGSTPDLIGPASGAPWEKFVWIELALFRPNIPGPVGLIPDPPGRAQKLLAGLQEAFEQLMVCKYGARPHYGKMWKRVYASTACPIRDLFPHFDLQLKLQDKYDPAKIFESGLLSTLIAGGDTDSQYPSCSNEMMCYCTSDADCGVTATGVAYKCRTAPAPLPPYKVCLPP